VPCYAFSGRDVLIGLPSSGVHSNGYSLVRYLVKMANMAFHDPCPFAANGASSLGEALLTPTRIYVKALMPLVKAHKLKGLVHITGGGFQDNIPRYDAMPL
jgi:phosphoribosylaminoimidazole (AIR) synthetase